MSRSENRSRPYKIDTQTRNFLFISQSQCLLNGSVVRSASEVGVNFIYSTYSPPPLPNTSVCMDISFKVNTQNDWNIEYKSI